MTASKYCKKYGFNLKKLSEVSGISTQTLTNWFNDRPKLFKLVAIGAKEEIKKWDKEG